MKTILWPHQRASYDALRESFARGKRRPLVMSPTGSGKTILAAKIVEEARKRDKRVAFVVPAISLIDQTRIAFFREGIADVGVIQADHGSTDWSKPVQVCSADTLARRDFPIANVIIVDEAHVVKTVVRRWMEEEPEKVFIGLSATPWRRGLGTLYDDLIVAATIERLIDERILSPFKVYAPSRPDLSGVEIRCGEYVRDQLGKIARADKALVGDVVETWLKRGEDRPTICFAVDRAHAKMLQERFADAGVSAAYVDHKTTLSERNAVAKDFAAGRTKVVCNVDCLGIGVDWPNIGCMILARPTRSVVRYVQNVGRGLRSAPGKDHLLILDHSDTTLRLGFVTDIKRDKLSNGKLSKTETESDEIEAPLPSRCKVCAFLKPAGIYKCPQCGHEPERKTRAVVVDGELAELTEEEIERMRAEAKQRKEKREHTPEMKLRWWRMILGHARRNGKSRGWASHTYRAKFDVWPNGMGEPPPLDPDVEVLGFIKHRAIAWAKSSRRNGNGHAGARP